MTSKWAPVVYSRTQHVDFRLLAVPGDALDAAGKERIIDGIKPMLGAPAELRSRPAWAVFTTGTHCVFGVAAYIRDIADGPLDPDITHVGVREIYAFAGWAARLDGPVQLPLYDQLDVALARPSLATVQAHWNEHDYDRQVDATSYDVELPAAPGEAAEEWRANAGGVTISPVERSRALWNAAARALRRAGDRNVSLCIDLPYAQDAYDSAYVQVTARDAHDVRVHRAVKPTVPPEDTPSHAPSRDRHPAFDDFSRADDRDDKPSRAAIRTGALAATVLTACILAVWQRWFLLLLAVAGGAWVFSRNADHDREAPAPDDADDPLMTRRRAARTEPRPGKSAWD